MGRIKNDRSIFISNIYINNNYQNTSAAIKLFKTFYKLYKQKYWGWKIKADFHNKKLSEMFQRFVDKGLFPNDINETSNAYEYCSECGGHIDDEDYKYYDGLCIDCYDKNNYNDEYNDAEEEDDNN